MAVPAAIVASQPAPPADLLDTLRLGGYVIVLRHGATNADAARDGMSNPDKKPTGERQLSDAGRAQAIAIGEGLRRLGIRAGVVMTSPLQRAVDTATLLGIGEVKVAPDLAEAGSALSRAENDRRADILRKLVGYHSGPDNFVIVTHRPNLIEAFGDFSPTCAKARPRCSRRTSPATATGWWRASRRATGICWSRRRAPKFSAAHRARPSRIRIEGHA